MLKQWGTFSVIVKFRMAIVQCNHHKSRTEIDKSLCPDVDALIQIGLVMNSLTTSQ